MPKFVRQAKDRLPEKTTGVCVWGVCVCVCMWGVCACLLLFSPMLWAPWGGASSLCPCTHTPRCRPPAWSSLGPGAPWLWLSSASGDPCQRSEGGRGADLGLLPGQGGGDVYFLHLDPISSQLSSMDQLLGSCHYPLLSSLQAESGNSRKQMRVVAWGLLVKSPFTKVWAKWEGIWRAGRDDGPLRCVSVRCDNPSLLQHFCKLQLINSTSVSSLVIIPSPSKWSQSTLFWITPRQNRGIIFLGWSQMYLDPSSSMKRALEKIDSLCESVLPLNSCTENKPTVVHLFLPALKIEFQVSK